MPGLLRAGVAGLTMADEPMPTWRVTLRTRSLATGHEADQPSQVSAPDRETAIEVASLRSSRSHGRVVTIGVISCERLPA